MSPLVSCAFLLVMACLAGASFWINNRIRSHVQRNHPLHIDRISVPPPPLGPADRETRGTDEFWRLSEFIASGRAARLGDPVLDQLIRWRRRVFWMFIVVFVAAFARVLL